MSSFLEKVYSKLNLSVNMPLEIEVLDKNAPGRYRSIILEYDPSIQIARIGVPIYKGTFIRVFGGTEVKIRVFSSNAVFLFSSKITGKGKEGNVRYLTVNVPEVIYRVQRRIHVRVSIVEEGYLYKTEEYEKNEEPKKYRFVSKDFSAGGISIVAKESLKNSEKILVNINFRNEMKFENKACSVIRKIGETEFNEGIYGIKFEDVSYNEEKEIVKFVFKYQIESSKKNKRI